MDVRVYSAGYYLAEKGRYQGICKLPNGADIVVFDVPCEENSNSICQVLYFDGTDLRIFTPFAGNAVNVAFMTALGDEYYSWIEKFEGKLFDKVYPNGLPASDDENFHEKATEGYGHFLGMSEEGKDSWYVTLDWNAMDDEIERVLS